MLSVTVSAELSICRTGFSLSGFDSLRDRKADRLKPVLLKNRHMRGDDPPAFGETHPDLALPP